MREMFAKLLELFQIKYIFIKHKNVLNLLSSEYKYIGKHYKRRQKMIVEEKKNVSNSSNLTGSGVLQNLILENREKLNISGVNDVLSFDDEVVIIETELGLLTVKGENLKINKLNIDTSEVIVEGKINSLSYSEHTAKSEGGILGKIFK